ncbi:MAG: hypothetical protein CL862_07935 [Cyanobium sp. NAT70]|nr:hypothetical protein [Cyanobium sp. NAT70]
MGIFDRLASKVKGGSGQAAQPRVKGPKKDKPEAFFLDADSSSTLGDVDYMRESKTIRHTFPGTADSPGNKERVTEVDAKSEQLTKRTQGLGGAVQIEDTPNVTAGVPKPVKKTFASQVSQAEMKQRLKGAAVTGVNKPAPAGAAPVARKETLKPTKQEAPINSYGGRPPAGSIDPFRQMVRDLNK